MPPLVTHLGAEDCLPAESPSGQFILLLNGPLSWERRLIQQLKETTVAPRIHSIICSKRQSALHFGKDGETMKYIKDKNYAQLALQEQFGAHLIQVFFISNMDEKIPADRPDPYLEEAYIDIGIAISLARQNKIRLIVGTEAKGFIKSKALIPKIHILCKKEIEVYENESEVYSKIIRLIQNRS